MNNFASIFLGLIISSTSFGQTDVKIRVSPQKINNHIDILIPNSDGSYYYEKYFYFRQSNFNKISLDTLFKISDSIYKGKETTVNIKEFTSKVHCDPYINRIRNSSLNDAVYRMLEDSAKIHIGKNNIEFVQKSRKSAPTYEEEEQICHDDFKKLSENWFKNQIELIHSIKEKKIKRYEWINETDSISNIFLHEFTRDFGNCEADHKTLLVLIQKETDRFLTICKYMEDFKFSSFLFNLNGISNSMSTESAISSLKNSKIRTIRKRKIIKLLSKKE